MLDTPGWAWSDGRMTTPDRTPHDDAARHVPGHPQCGDARYHMTAASYWLDLAHSINDDENYHGEPVDDGDTTQDTHVIKYASLATAHAAIAQALLGYGR